MSSIDKHAVQAVADLKAGYTLGHADVAILNELARIALASLEAEASGRNPVLAYADSYRDMANQGVESIPVWSVITDLERNIAPLFTAPPAPVSVPAAMNTDDDFDSAFEHGKAVGWNACRAAMLQGAEQQNQQQNIPENIPPLREAVDTIRNSGIEIDAEKILAERDALNGPVIQDGWVACSERMPEEGDDMIVFTDEIVMSGVSYSKKKGFYLQALEYDDDEPVDNVTHWMPLPAAPQQEVK
ncbi:TPA: DUF551 domain-containing protein [Enterobacter hormaechei subsp. xiangfangensis]|nr:DUF551 domain-containing protein [Enterobacter hormaechei subsp. xiangfangensis]